MIPPFVLSVSSWSPWSPSSDQYFLGWTRHQPRARAGSCLTHWSARQCPHCWHCHQVPIITVKTIHHLATLAIASCRHSHSLDFAAASSGRSIEVMPIFTPPPTPELCVCSASLAKWAIVSGDRATVITSPGRSDGRCCPPRVNYWLPILSHLTRSSDTIPLPGPALDIVSYV